MYTNKIQISPKTCDSNSGTNRMEITVLKYSLELKKLRIKKKNPTWKKAWNSLTTFLCTRTVYLLSESRVQIIAVCHFPTQCLLLLMFRSTQPAPTDCTQGSQGESSCLQMQCNCGGLTMAARRGPLCQTNQRRQREMESAGTIPSRHPLLMSAKLVLSAVRTTRVITHSHTGSQSEKWGVWFKYLALV